MTGQRSGFTLLTALVFCSKYCVVAMLNVLEWQYSTFSFWEVYCYIYHFLRLCIHKISNRISYIMTPHMKNLKTAIP